MAVTDVHRTLHILRSTIRCSTRRPGSSPSFYTASGRGYARIHLAPRGRQSSLVVSAGRSAAMRELEAGREERRAQELEAKRPVGASFSCFSLLSLPLSPSLCQTSLQRTAFSVKKFSPIRDLLDLCSFPAWMKRMSKEPSAD